MSVTAKIGIKLLRTGHGFINTCVLIVILLLLAFGCYAMWDSGQIHSAASSANYEKYRPAAEDSGASFEYLQEINPDVFAWLTVYGTNIDYPMVQGLDNIRYVNISAEGRFSLSGAIFLDYRNSPHFTDFNNIVYGHHMESRTMFGEIAMFSDKDYFDARRYGTLFFEGQERGLEFFAFLHTDANDTQIFRTSFTGPESQQAYLDLIMETAVNIRDDIHVTIDDRIILLSTCSPNSTNGRDILIGIITDDIQDNPFVTEQTDSPIIIPTIDELPDLWKQSEIWTKMIVGSLVSLIILLVTALISRMISRIVSETKRIREKRETKLSRLSYQLNESKSRSYGEVSENETNEL